jgi:nucleotide-binding universal stress UspA family protein
MLQLTRILAPTDFSEHSNHALGYAADLARQFRARLVLVHVVSNDALESISKAHVPPHPVDKVYEDLTQEVREQYAKHVAPAVRKFLETEILVLPGVPYLEIVCKRVDLIVMATHGRTGLSHALMGSVTEKVLRKAPCPVLSIRPVGVESVAYAA